MVSIEEFVVGSSDTCAPIGGVNTWQIPLLKNALIQQSFVNETFETQSGASPSYAHNYAEGLMTRFKPDGTANNWKAGDVISITINKP